MTGDWCILKFLWRGENYENILATLFLLCDSHQHQRFKDSYLYKTIELVNTQCIHH